MVDESKAGQGEDGGSPVNTPKKKSIPKLETRIKRWAEHTHDDGMNVREWQRLGVDLLREYYRKQQKKKPKSLGKRAREKGAEYMRFVAKKLAVVFPFAAVRSQYTGGGKDGCDVEKTAYFVEAKNCKTLSIPAWWKQLLTDKAEAQDERPPALMFKLALKGRNEHLVAITLEEFVRLQRISHGIDRRKEDHGMFGFYQDIGFGCESRLGFALPLEGEKWEAHTEKDWSIIPNPRKGSDGLWSTLDGAEAAIRRVQ